MQFPAYIVEEPRLTATLNNPITLKCGPPYSLKTCVQGKMRAGPGDKKFHPVSSPQNILIFQNLVTTNNTEFPDIMMNYTRSVVVNIFVFILFLFYV
jgi:hypothetical protein